MAISAGAQPKPEDTRGPAALRSSLCSARIDHEFGVLFQPQVELLTGRCVGAEALLRWRHPCLGLLTPDTFMSLAEETGRVIEIGRFVLKTACQAASKWNRHADVPLRIAVNLSSRQFVQNDIVADVRNALDAAGCCGSWLECEITENHVLNNDVKIHLALAELGRIGVTIAVDDFGIGQSVVSFLNQLNIDTLKFDRTFVTGMERDHRRVELIRALVSFAQAIGVSTVAEGIENEEQMRLLLDLGCMIGQGYHFCRPITEDEFRRVFVAGLDRKRYPVCRLS